MAEVVAADLLTNANAARPDLGRTSGVSATRVPLLIASEGLKPARLPSDEWKAFLDERDPRDSLFRRVHDFLQASIIRAFGGGR